MLYRVPSASPDEMVVKVYPLLHETTDIRASFDRRRARDPEGGLALAECLHPAPLPDPARQRQEPKRLPDSPRPGLQPANGAQRHPRVQREGSPRGTPAGIAPPAHRSSGLRCGGSRGFAGDASSGSPWIRQGYEPVDVGSRCLSELRGGLDDAASERGDHPGHSGAPRSALGVGQAVDNQPRPRVRKKKASFASDRLIRLAATHPEWAVGFLEETWFSRLARPSLHSWSDAGEPPVRLIEQSVAKDDPDPKAISCYGLYVPELEKMWVRFVDGRPVSAITTRFLWWCCQELQAAGKKVWVLIWDNASWHISKEVREWMTSHNREVKNGGEGVRIVSCLLPTKSPWLNSMEPKWVHGKRKVVEPDGLLTAHELAERVCGAFGCPHYEHLSIPENAA